MKYLIKARLEVDGRVDKHDVIGAIFGQTEGLLGSEFNLEELQKKDKIGRVHVEIRYHGTKTIGTIMIPSNLDRVETAILAAMIETVDRIGPYNARITVEEIKDLRAEKLKRILQRSKEILKMIKEKEPDIKEILREVQSIEEEKPKITEYGPEKLPAGPDVDKSDTIIIVEGRADVLNLLRYGYTNVIALEGAREKIPKTIIELAKKKKVIALVDGDRGGELILKTLLDQADVDYVARAPKGMEVEELTGKEIAQALEQMVPAEVYKKKLGLAGKEKPEKPEKVEEKTPAKPEKVEEKSLTPPPPPKPEVVEAPAKKPEAKPAPQEVAAIPKEVIEEIPKLRGSLEAILYDKEWKPIKRISVRDLYPELQKAEPGSIGAVVFDGIITPRILEVASERGVKILIGARTGTKLSGKPKDVLFFTFNDLV